MKAPRRPSPVLAATWGGLAAAAVLIPIVPGRPPAPPAAVLEVTFRADRAGAMQAFFDVGGGYNERDSSTAAYTEGGPHVVALSLPAGTFPALRLDPAKNPVGVAIESLRIRTHGAAEAGEIPLAHVHAGQQTKVVASAAGLEVTCSGDDPMLFIASADPICVGSAAEEWKWLKPAAGGAALAVASVALAWFLATRRVAFSGWHRGRAWLLAALVAVVATRLVGLGTPLLEWYGFRQTQTALSAYWMAVEGVSLPGYPLPVLGRPWTAPLEFPTYQILAAGLHRLGVPLDAACRGLALACFAASFAVLAWTLRRHGCPPRVIAALAVPVVASPFAFISSRAGLIEYMAVLPGLGCVALAMEAHARGMTLVRCIAIVLAGSLAALTKVTSFPVYWPALVLLGAHAVWRSWRAGRSGARLAGEAACWAAVLLVPLACAKVWIDASDGIKSMSEATAWLTSSRTKRFTTGPFGQAMNVDEWRIILRRIRVDLLPWLWPFVFVGIPAIVRLPVRVALASLGMLAGALGTVVSFFNLYVVHEYYLCAVAFPLWLAAAAGVAAVARRLPAGPWRRAVLPVALGAVLAASGLSRGVWNAYGRFDRDPVITFSSAARPLVPEDAEIIVVGDDWNSRLPYYMRRKALMQKTGRISDVFLRDYAAAHGVRHFVGTAAAEPDLQRLFPAARRLAIVDGFVLYREE